MLMADGFSLNGRRMSDRQHRPRASLCPERRRPVGGPREAFNLKGCRYSKSH